MAHDAGVCEQPPDVAVAEAGDTLEVEARECRAEVLALPQDREPRQPGLEALQAQLLEQSLLVVDREAPLGVVVRAVDLGRVAPEAACDAVLAAPESGFA